MSALLEEPANEFKPWLDLCVDSSPADPAHNRCSPRNPPPLIRLKIFCGLLIVVGVFVRIWQLDQIPGLNGDEAWYGVQSQRFLDEYLHGKSLPLSERVTFRTPTGNIWNPFLMVPRIMLDAAIPPSVWSLRLPALISGILALLINWWLCSRAFDRTTAWLTTAGLSILPISVIYSRLGWDSCQSLLFCLPLLYLPLISEKAAWSARRTFGCFAITVAAALLVHPTNIFIVPVCVVMFWPRVNQATKWEFSLRSTRILAATAVGGAFLIGSVRGVWADVQLSNVGSALFQWVADFTGLFQGATVYGSISLPATDLSAAQVWLGLLSMPTIALLSIARYCSKSPWMDFQTNSLDQRYALLFDGFSVAVLCFLGVAGQAAIQPGYERYGMWLIAPGVLLVVMASLAIFRRSRSGLVCVTIISILQVALLLVGYWCYYQRRFDMPAAEQKLAHWTYRKDDYATWPELLKTLQSSLNPAETRGRNTIHINAADPQRWWFEWKWRYLSYGTGFEWRVIPCADDLAPAVNQPENRWLLESQQDAAKEKLSIRYLAN